MFALPLEEALSRRIVVLTNLGRKLGRDGPGLEPSAASAARPGGISSTSVAVAARCIGPAEVGAASLRSVRPNGACDAAGCSDPEAPGVKSVRRARYAPQRWPRLRNDANCRRTRWRTLGAGCAVAVDSATVGKVVNCGGLETRRGAVRPSAMEARSECAAALSPDGGRAPDDELAESACELDCDRNDCGTRKMSLSFISSPVEGARESVVTNLTFLR